VWFFDTFFRFYSFVDLRSLIGKNKLYQMENDIIDSLEDLGYTGPLLEDQQFQNALESSACTKDLTELVAWATTDLALMANLEETVRPISSLDDSDAFLMELSGFLRECNCPYSALTDGSIDQRLASKSNKLLLINYLVTELQAARITATVNMLTDDVQHMKINRAAASTVSKHSEVADLLKQTMIALGIPKPPDNITAALLFEKFGSKISELLSSMPERHLGKPLLCSELSEAQWESVEFIAQAMRQDYEYRRQMLLQRLGVTIESFTWSDRLQHREDQMAAVYHPIRQRMTVSVQTGMAQLLAARDDLLGIERTSSGMQRQRTVCDVNRIIIGSVPDRGGRAYEHDRPLPEMPAFQQRCGGGHRGGGGPRGGGGGQQRHRGGWSHGGEGGGEFWHSKRGRYK
jgi:hypothetical protein